MLDDNNNKPFRLYSNDIQLAVSLFDVTLQFSHNIPESPQLLGRISMSPQHAKALLGVLHQNIIQYEEMFGKIPAPDEEMFKQLQQEGKLQVGQQA